VSELNIIGNVNRANKLLLKFFNLQRCGWFLFYLSCWRYY